MKKIWNWIKNAVLSFVIEEEEIPEESNKEIPLYLACNGMYMAVIESIERQIEQIKIDYALGTIDKDIYDQHFENFQKRVKELSANYAKELLYAA